MNSICAQRTDPEYWFPIDSFGGEKKGALVVNIGDACKWREVNLSCTRTMTVPPGSPFGQGENGAALVRRRATLDNLTVFLRGSIAGTNICKL